MYITEMVTTTYTAMCQVCGNLGPMATKEEWAAQRAIGAGWQAPIYFNGLRYVSTTVCPQCAEEPDYAQWLKAMEATE